MAEANWLETNKEKLSERDWDKYPLQLADTGVFLVLDVDNGNVLAMAQYPTYDLNVLIAGGEEAASILTDERNVMMNYAIQQRAEPGSVFKMVTALAALVNNKITPITTISDKGPFTAYTNNEKEAPTCWANKTVRNSHHQNLDIIHGLSKSCNYFFYELGHRRQRQHAAVSVFGRYRPDQQNRHRSARRKARHRGQPDHAVRFHGFPG